MPEHVRAWLYRVALAVIPLLVFYGVISEDASGLWAALAGALLGIVPSLLGTVTTSTRREDCQRDE